MAGPTNLGVYNLCMLGDRWLCRQYQNHRDRYNMHSILCTELDSVNIKNNSFLIACFLSYINIFTSSMSLRSFDHVTKGFGETNKDNVYEDFFLEI